MYIVDQKGLRGLVVRHILLFLLVAIAVYPATYYVSPDGDDRHDGSLGAPWASASWATRRMQGGDELVLLPGTYVQRVFDADILQPPSGSAQQVTRIRGSDSGAAVLAGADNLYALINLSGAHYVEISDLEFTHDGQEYARDGINATAEPCSHIVLRNLHIHHLDEFGLNIRDVTDLTVDSCTIHHCGFGAAGGPEAGSGGGWQNVRFTDSQLSRSGHYYQNGDSENPYGRPDGFGIEPGPGPVEFVRCRLEHNHGDGLDSKSDTTIVRSCIIANNRTDGLKLWGRYGRIENTLIYGRGDGDATPTPWSAVVIDTEFPNAVFEFVHCSIDDSLGQNYCMWAQYDHPQVPIHVNMLNTIISSRGRRSSLFLTETVNFSVSHTLFWMPENDILLQHGQDEYSAETIPALGDGVLAADPRFVRPAWGGDGDYRLSASSPALNAAMPTHLVVDLAGNPRHQGAAPDLGAYERSTETAVQTRAPLSKFNVSCAPNPANPGTRIHFYLSKPGPVNISIYDMLGRRISTLNRVYSAGSHYAAWDGRNDQGAVCPSGIYLIVLDTETYRHRLKLALVH
ncbi:MAG: right-handed parallel beta-helix repeat-containing protein [candidate division KSB1 bacterium]|nr:right-handed parallel beta-helix repeat-containing protein [candidate division KSB1 bacterium]